MSAPPSERLAELSQEAYEILADSGIPPRQASRLASMIELIARLVLADDKQRGQP